MNQLINCYPSNYCLEVGFEEKNYLQKSFQTLLDSAVHLIQYIYYKCNIY